METHKPSHLLEGLLFGGMVGLAAGLVLAPVAGEETRNRIKSILRELDLSAVIDRISQAFNEGIMEARKVSEEMK